MARPITTISEVIGLFSVKAIDLKTIELDTDYPRRQTSMAISSTAETRSKIGKATHLDVRHGTFFLLVTTEESGRNRGGLIWRRLDHTRQDNVPN